MTARGRLSHTFNSFVQGFPSSFWVLFAGTLVSRAGDFILPFLSLYLTGPRKFSIESASVIVSALGLGRFFAQWLGGILNDRWGSKPTMLLSLSLSALAALVLSVVQGYAALFAVVLTFGLLLQMYGPASKAAVATMLEGSLRIRAFGLIYWAINVGTIIAPVIGGVLSSVSYSLLFYLNAAVLAFFALLIWRFFVEPQAQEKEPRAQEKQGKDGDFKAPRITVFPRDPLLYAYAALGVLFSVTWFQGFSTLSLALKLQGFSAADYGKVFALNGLVVVLVSLPLNRLLPKYPPNLVMMCSALCLAAGLGLHALTSSLPGHPLWGHAVAVTVWTLGEIVEFTVLSSVIAALAPPHLRGTYQGISGAAGGLGAMFAPLLGGYGLTHWGVVGLYSFAAALALVMVVVQLFLKGPTEKRIGKTLELG